MVTNYYYSQGGVLYTEDGNGKGTSLNLHGTSGNIIATGRKAENKEGYYYYHKDPAGSITNLRDAGGKSIVSYQYTDFGQTDIHGDADFYNEICYNESIILLHCKGRIVNILSHVFSFGNSSYPS